MLKNLKAAYRALLDPSALKSSDPSGFGIPLNYGGFNPAVGYGVNRDLFANKYGAASAMLLNHAVFACVDTLASDVSAATWRLVDVRTDEQICSANDYHSDQPVFRALNRYARRNDGINLFYMWMMHKAVTGEVFVELLRNQSNEPADLEFLNSLITNVEEQHGEIAGFTYNGAWSGERLGPDQVVYDRYRTNIMTDIYGHSPLMTVIGSGGLNVMRSAGRAMLAYFQNDGLPGSIATPRDGNGWTERQMELVRAAISKNQGSGNKYRTAIFPLPINLEVFQQPDLRKWAELLHAIEPQVYTAYRIPRSVAGDSDTTRYDTSDWDVPNYHRTLVSNLKLIAGVVNTRVIPFFYGRASDVRFEFDLSPYESVSTETATLAREAYTGGAATLNEYRQRAGLDLLPDGGEGYSPERRRQEQDILRQQFESLAIDMYTYQALSGVRDPDRELIGQYYVNGLGVVPKQELTQLWRYRLMTSSAGVTDSQVPQLAPPPDDTPPDSERRIAKTADNGWCIMAHIGAHDEIIRIQDIVRGVLGEDAEYNNPETFHITVAYGNGDLEGAYSDVLYSGEPIAATVIGIGVFDTPDGYAVHLVVKASEELREMQAWSAGVFESRGLELSPYSKPDSYNPHITLAYAKREIKAFDITPFAVVITELTLGNPAHEIVATRPLEMATEQRAIDELKAWYKVASKSLTRPFVNVAIDDGTATLIRRDLDTADDKDAMSAVFKQWRRVLEARISITDYDDLKADDLPAPVKAVIDSLIVLNLPADDAHTVARRFYAALIGIKALAQTEARFIAELVRQMTNAYEERVTRNVFIRRMLTMIERYSRQAWADAYTELGIEIDWNDFDDEDVQARDRWVNTWTDSQEVYISNIADELYADDEITLDEIRELKGQLWWNSSVYPAYAEALTTARLTVRLRWQIGVAEHCRSCLALNGQIRTARFWASIDLKPKDHRLECNGFNCACSFEVTDEPVSKGPLPKWEFAKSAHVHDETCAHEHENDGGHNG